MKKIHLKDCSTTHKGKKYRKYAIATSEKIDNKNQKRIIVYLGNLTDETVANYRMLFKAINNQSPQMDKFSNIEELLYEDDKQYLNVIIMHKIWNRLKLDKVFSNNISRNQKISTQHVAQILTINRLLAPKSKVKTVDWLQETLLSNILNIDERSYNKDKIFHELANIHKAKDKIENLFMNFSRNNFKASQENVAGEIFYFDGTTTWFEGTKSNLAEYTKEKTRGFYDKVIGFVIVSDKNGYPVAWEVIPGKQKDQTAFEAVAKRLREKYKIKEITYCFDRGVASIDNYKIIESCESKFISGINDDQIKKIFNLDYFCKFTLKTILDYCQRSKEERRGMLPIDKFYSAGRDKFYKDLGEIKRRRYIVSFNKEIYESEKIRREDNIEETLTKVNALNSKLKQAKKNREYVSTEKQLLEIFRKNGTQLFFEYELVPQVTQSKTQTYKIILSLKKEIIAKKSATDGLLVYITNHIEKEKTGIPYFIVSAYTICKHYSDKFIIENIFRQMKSFLDLRPIYVLKDDHIAAHFDIAVMGYFIENYIYRHLAVSRRNFAHYLQTLSKGNYRSFIIIEQELIARNIDPKKLFDKLRIKRIINEIFEKSNLQEEFYQKLLKYTDAISLSVFYKTVRKNSLVIKLKAPNGVSIYKRKEGSKDLKKILSLLDLNYLFPSSPNSSVTFSN